MKRSISVTGHVVFLTAGSGGLPGTSKAQCALVGAPCSTHRRSMAICAAVNCLPLFLDGIRSSGSSFSIRSMRSLSSGLPGTIATPPPLSLLKAPSFVSSRSPALRFRSSGPWQAKQLSERIGRTSRAKFTAGDLASFVRSPGESARAEPTLPSKNAAIAIRKQLAMPSPFESVVF